MLMLTRTRVSGCHAVFLSHLGEFSYEFLKNGEIIDIHMNLFLNETSQPG